jgi:predicted GNAT family acetyltransferase
MCEHGEMERVADNAAKHRYEILVDDEVVGFTQYRDREGVRDIFHTEVFPGWEGRGLASRLLQGALDDIRGRELGLRATCPLLVGYLEKHPEEKELLG